MNSCVFCEGEFADPIQPHNRQKICVLFDVSFNGKKLLHDSRICTRCQVQLELIDNAVRLKAEMNQCLQDKLAKHGDSVTSGAAGSRSASNGETTTSLITVCHRSRNMYMLNRKIYLTLSDPMCVYDVIE